MTQGTFITNGDSVSMAKFKFTGIEAYTESLEKIGGKNAVGVLKYAVYPGAKVVADAIRVATEQHKDTGDLSSSLALSTMRNDDGYVNTKIEFAGYDRKGVPNAVKAASLESGNSRGQKATHFISHTVKTVQSKAIAEMSKALDEKIGFIMEG